MSAKASKLIFMDADSPIMYSYLSKFGKVITDPKEMVNCDLVVFSGGPDVSPLIYREVPHKTTNFMFQRDQRDLSLYRNAKILGLPVFGICRGSQLLCCLAGGSLIQDIGGGHRQDHAINIDTNATAVTVNSTHHQMMNLGNTNHTLLGFAINVASYLETGDGTDLKAEDEEFYAIEPEIVYFKDINGLSVQFHPERMNKREKAVKYVNMLVRKLLNNQEI